MRVLLDECLPRRLAGFISGHAVSTVPQAGWAGLKNGVLLARIGGAFDAFVTIDANLQAQQNVRDLAFGVVVLHARSNRLADLLPLVPALEKALIDLAIGQVVHLKAPA